MKDQTAICLLNRGVGITDYKPSTDHQVSSPSLASGRHKAQAREGLSHAVRSPLASQATTWAGPASCSQEPGHGVELYHKGGSIMAGAHTTVRPALDLDLHLPLQAEQTELHCVPSIHIRALEAARASLLPVSPTVCKAAHQRPRLI